MKKISITIIFILLMCSIIPFSTSGAVCLVDNFDGRLVNTINISDDFCYGSYSYNTYMPVYDSRYGVITEY